MNKKMPITAAARKNLIANLISRQSIDSQESLIALLKREGIHVTQATASRDLVDLGAHRERDRQGVMRYVLPSEPVAARNGGLLLSAQSSGNIVVLRTPPGGAQLLASSLDQSAISTLLGTIAGDDTVIAIASTSTGGTRLISQIEEFLGSSRVKSSRKVQKRVR